ncbi:MAG: hypothetical protein ACLSH8_04090 [Zhenhengia sp.]|uniref:hypothetical protein n=1 Tax=Zhenhengia sp. TaxID=2944208 RepID=UPI003991C07F
MFFLMRCMPSSEVKDFIKTGAIQFSYPDRWVNLDEGRGDYREGVYAFIQFDDVANAYRLGTKFNDVERFTKNGVVHCRRRSVMKLPTYCLYSFKAEQFAYPNKAGLHPVEASITDSYFKDFHFSNSNDPMKSVIIHKPDAFFDALKTSLINLGVKEEEILIQEVNYRPLDFDSYSSKGYTWLEVPEPSPYELFSKDSNRFKIQEELRIVINTSDPRIIHRLTDYPNPIFLGDMSSYSQSLEDYPLDGLVIKGTGVIVEKDA